MSDETSSSEGVATEGPPRHSARRRRDFIALTVVWLAAAAYLLLFVDRGWNRGDEGLLGQSAERVLHGELPHQDFDDMYTGGLALLHAATFRGLGIRLTSLRWVLYVATLLFVPLVYFVARRVAGPILAAATTALSVIWSVPNYFASMPSWYNLFLAVAALLALFLAIERGQRRWLALAGLCAGLSFLFKSAALLLVAGVFLFLVYRTLESRGLGDGGPRASKGFAVVVTVGMAAFVAVLVGFIGGRPGPMQLALYVAPGTAIAGWLTVRAWQAPAADLVAQLRHLARATIPFLTGFLAPVVVFALFFAQRGALGALLDPAVLFPSERLRYTFFPLPPLLTVVCAIPVGLVLLVPIFRTWSPRLDRRLAWPVALVGVAVATWGNDTYLYQVVWFSLRPLVPMLAIGALALLAIRRAGDRLDPVRRQQLLLLVSVTSLCSLVQFPFAWGIYFCYVAPLVILSALFVARSTAHQPGRVSIAVMAMYGVFALAWLNTGHLDSLGVRFAPRPQGTLLEIDRGGLWVGSNQALVYGRLIDEVRRHSQPGDAILATPDCPEVYFLSGRRNPTRTFADFFDEDYEDPPTRKARLLALLERERIPLVVFHHTPSFSRLPDGFADAVLARYPQRLDIGPFSLVWRDRAAGAAS